MELFDTHFFLVFLFVNNVILEVSLYFMVPGLFVLFPVFVFSNLS